MTDDEYCQDLIQVFAGVFPDLCIKGGADEPFYAAAKDGEKATVYFRDNYPRSLLHELAHYCLAGQRRRQIDDFGYWYCPCGRTSQEQEKFEAVEARPQGLEKVMCEIVGLKFSPSLDDFSARPPSKKFLHHLDIAYQEMLSYPPPSAQKALCGLRQYKGV